VTLVPGGHPLRFKKRFGVADLAGLPLIEWPHCPLHPSFIRLLAEHGIALTVRASAEREELLLHLVDAGIGLAEVPQSHAAHARHAPARPLDGALAFDRHRGLACGAFNAPMLALLGVVAAGAAAPAPLPSAAQETCAPGAGAGTTGAAPPPQALP
jgi:hypothetical protein